MPITMKCDYCEEFITGIINLARHYQENHLEILRKEHKNLGELDLTMIYLPIEVRENDYIN